MKDTVLIEMQTTTFGGMGYDSETTTTVTERAIERHGERLIIEQQSDRGELEWDAADTIVLDEPTQRALYLVLKERFA
jgi:hypothetical protein